MRCGIVCGLGLALLCACQRYAPEGAEAAAHAADQQMPVSAVETPQPSPAAPAQNFVSQASASNAFEIAAAEAARQRAQNAAVKDFAAMMVHDHTDSSGELKKAVGEAGESLTPAAAPAPEQQAQLDQLRRIDAQAFDRTYMDGQLQAHQKALALMQSYAQNGEVPSLKAFAGKAGSVVEHHLDLARSLDEQLP